MKAVKILVTVAAVVAVAFVAAPDASANCGQNKFFRSGGMDSTDNVRIIPGYAGQAPGNEVGRWWDSANANLSSNFGPNANTCNSVGGWWKALPNGNMYIDGILDGPGCVGYAGCPGQEMTVVIEDYGPTGAPGINDTAYYVGWRVDDTPADLRRYNYGRVDNGIAGTTNYPFLEFPKVVLSGSNRNGGNVEVNYNLADQSALVHTASGAGDAALPVSSVVAQWHLMQFNSSTDPGRERSGWNLLEAIDYSPGGSNQFASVPCTDIITDSWLAVGIGFDGGAAGIINSEFVGEAVQLECDPNVADPGDGLKQVKPRPDGDQPIQSAPRRSGGRR